MSDQPIQNGSTGRAVEMDPPPGTGPGTEPRLGVDLRVDWADLGRLGYADALAVQRSHHVRLVEQRRSDSDAPSRGTVLFVEHEPVVTVSRRRGADSHVLVSDDALRAAGVDRQPTDRGGDVTYHGPGQLVCYPILDLNAFGLRLHEYMRVLEQTVIDALASFGVVGERDPGATGVWVSRNNDPPAKIAAMGVRVSRWVSMHGLSLNVAPDMSHFALIDPCGLGGRPVTSLAQLKPDGETPTLAAARDAVASSLAGQLAAKLVERSKGDQPS